VICSVFKWVFESRETSIVVVLLIFVDMWFDFIPSLHGTCSRSVQLIGVLFWVDWVMMLLIKGDNIEHEIVLLKV
jgi:hypothetical protein